MDVGEGSFISSKLLQSQFILGERTLNMRSSQENLDRFIPNRSAMDFDFARYMLTEARKGKESPATSSMSKENYRKGLAKSLNLNRTRILAFRNKPPVPVKALFTECASPVKANEASKNNSSAKTIIDKYSGRSRGFGFVSFIDTVCFSSALSAMDGRPGIETGAPILVKIDLVQ